MKEIQIGQMRLESIRSMNRIPRTPKKKFITSKKKTAEAHKIPFRAFFAHFSW
jgi:hypothetical protein